MDLIYADSNLNDLGVLKSYDIDLAFGSDENNFELKTPISNNVLEIGMYIYYPGTGYGGIIDAKKVSRVNNNIVLSGRTLEGILEGAVISPDVGAAYYAAAGDANAIIKALITRCNLGFLFRGSDAEVGQISNYLFRYDKMYTGIIKMLNSADLTLAIKGVAGANNKTIFEISAVPIKDYSTGEEWTSDQIKVESGIYGNQTNHLLCLGSGNLAGRHVIHLFCDESGNVQPYKTTENPLSDADYILTETNKVFSGIAEVTEVYDYPSISSIENYIMLTAQPSDWSKQELFYTKDGNNYEQLDYAIESRFSELTAQPADWATVFRSYYEDVSGVYTSVAAEEAHTLLTTQPADWAANYGNYYTRYSDGVTVTWPSVKAATAERLELQTMQPSDWETNYGNYRTANGQAVQSVEYSGWVEGTHYTYDASGVKHWKHGIIINDNAKVYRDFRLDYARTATLESAYNVNSFQQFLNDFGENAQYVTINARMGEGYSVVDMVSNMRTANNLLSAVNRAYTVYKSNPNNETYRDYMQTIRLFESNTQDWLKSCENFEIKMYYVLSGNNYFVVCDPSSIFRIGAELHIVAAPAWYTNKYYTVIKYDTAPAWAANTYYKLEMVAPEYISGKYYKVVNVKVSNPFISGKYYRKLTDNYYNLVQAGIKKLAELRKANTITAKLDARREYGLGDIVAVRETLTNTTANMKVAKKILSGRNGNLSISYTLE